MRFASRAQAACVCAVIPGYIVVFLMRIYVFIFFSWIVVFSSEIGNQIIG